MNKLLSIFTLGLMMFAANAHADGMPRGRYEAVPFSLYQLEGDWELKDGPVPYVAYKFLLNKDSQGHESLTIQELNIVTQEVLAEGVGMRASGSDQPVRAAMKSKTATRLLYAGIYRDKGTGTVNPVVHLVPLEEPDAGRAYEMIKIAR